MSMSGLRFHGTRLAREMGCDEGFIHYTYAPDLGSALAEVEERFPHMRFRDSDGNVDAFYMVQINEELVDNSGTTRLLGSDVIIIPTAG
ncbi:hypothetical protein ACWGIU_36605 [Streptomyces sp. NPDC054840]